MVFEGEHEEDRPSRHIYTRAALLASKHGFVNLVGVQTLPGSLHHVFDLL